MLSVLYLSERQLATFLTSHSIHPTNVRYLISMGHIISISNQKGGVGKTTTAVNLSASIAAGDKDCLLIDSDPQGNATTGLGIRPDSLTYGLYDFLLEGIPFEKAVAQTALPRLHVLGATRNLIGADVEIASLPAREFLLRKALTSLKERFDYIFIDCPPSLGFLTVNALTAAESILIPVQCEYYALEGLSQLLRTAQAVKKSLNPTLRIADIVLTMYDKRNNLSTQVANEARSLFKNRVFRTVIPRNVRLSEAPSHGKPAILYDIRSTGAQSYLSLAKELIEKEQ
jgi:chromosome partitioning protein